MGDKISDWWKKTWRIMDGPMSRSPELDLNSPPVQAEVAVLKKKCRLCLVPKLATVFILKILKSYLRIFLIHLAHCFFTAVTLGTPGSHALLAWALLKQRRRFHTRTNATLGLSASSVKSRHTDVKFTSRLQAIQKMHLLTQTPNPDVLSESGRESGRLATNFCGNPTSTHP